MAASSQAPASPSWRAAWPQRWLDLLARLRLVPAGQESALLEELATAGAGVRVLAFANAHAFNLAARQPGFARELGAADVLLRDGAGLACLLRWRGTAPGLNLNGTDFIPRLLQRCDGRTVVVLGTREPHLSLGVDRLRRELMPHSRVRAMDGFRATAHYLDFVRRHRPAVLLLAMGMPRQEQLAQELRAALDFDCLIVCGGAIVDFLAGKVRRAPPWLRRLGLEWLWRLAQEPRRLFVRYVLGNPLFLWRAARLRRRQGPGAHPL